MSAKPNQIAAAKFAVNCEIEQSQLSRSPTLLEPEANRPNFLDFERGFLADDAALIPGASLRFGTEVIEFHLMFSI